MKEIIKDPNCEMKLNVKTKGTFLKYHLIFTGLTYECAYSKNALKFNVVYSNILLIELIFLLISFLRVMLPKFYIIAQKIQNQEISKMLSKSHHLAI